MLISSTGHARAEAEVFASFGRKEETYHSKAATKAAFWNMAIRTRRCKRLTKGSRGVKSPSRTAAYHGGGEGFMHRGWPGWQRMARMAGMARMAVPAVRTMRDASHRSVKEGFTCDVHAPYWIGGAGGQGGRGGGGEGGKRS